MRARATVRVFGQSEFTIRTWLIRAALYSTSLHEQFFRNLELLHIQLDELFTKTVRRLTRCALRIV